MRTNCKEEVLYEREEELLHCEGDITLKQAAQRVCAVSCGENPKSTWMLSCKTCIRPDDLHGTLLTPEILCDSVIFKCIQHLTGHLGHLLCSHSISQQCML